MYTLIEIRDNLFFPKNWKVLVYCILCCGLISLFLLASKENTSLIAILSIGLSFSLFFIALTFYDLRFGFYGMIVFGFLLASINRMTFSSLPTYSLLFFMPFALIFVILVKHSFQKERFKIDRHPLLLAYLVPFFYGLFEFFNPQMNALLGWVSYFRQALSLLVILFICLYLFKNLKNIRFFFQFLFGAIFLTALYGCIQQWFGLAPWDRRWVYSNPDILGLYSLYGRGLRKFSFLTDPANFGSLMAAGAIGTLILALESVKKNTKILLGFFTVVILIGMSYSGTRTASIMVIAGLVLYLLMTIYRKKTWILTLFAGLVFLFILYAPIYGNVTLFRIRTAFRTPANDASMQVRIINREKIRPYIYEHPFGGGIKTAGVAGQQYNPQHPLAGFPPDSSLFAIALEQGWVGLAIHLIFLFTVLCYAVHYFYHCQNEEIKTYYAVMTAMLFSLGLVGAYAQFTLASVPQFFIYIPFIAIIIKLQTFDNLKTTKVKS